MSNSSIITVITPPATRALTNIVTVRSDLAVDVGASDDTYLNSLIRRASGTVLSYIGRPDLGVQTVSETFRSDTTYPSYSTCPSDATYFHSDSYQAGRVNPLVLQLYPITNVANVVVDGTTLTANVDFEIDTQSALLYRLYNNVRTNWTGITTTVTYSAGYVLPNDNANYTLPTEIEDVVLSLIRQQYFNRGSDPSLILEVVEGVGRTGYAPNRSSGLNADQKITLNAYKRNVY